MLKVFSWTTSIIGNKNLWSNWYCSAYLFHNSFGISLVASKVFLHFGVVFHYCLLFISLEFLNFLWLDVSRPPCRISIFIIALRLFNTPTEFRLTSSDLKMLKSCKRQKSIKLKITYDLLPHETTRSISYVGSSHWLHS